MEPPLTYNVCPVTQAASSLHRSRGGRRPCAYTASESALNANDRVDIPPLQKLSSLRRSSSPRRRRGALRASRWDRGAASALPSHVGVLPSLLQVRGKHTNT